MDCPDCGEWFSEFPFPPGSLEQFDRAELPAAFGRWLRVGFQHLVAGFCPTCAGRVEGRLVADEPGTWLAGLPAHAEYECRRCGSTARASGATPALAHPAVTGFLFEYGFNALADPVRTLGATVAPPEGDLVSTDPPSLAVRFAAGGDAVTAVVGPDATVEVIPA